MILRINRSFDKEQFFHESSFPLVQLVQLVQERRRQPSAPLTLLGAADGARRHDVAELEGPGSRHGGPHFKILKSPETPIPLVFSTHTRLFFSLYQLYQLYQGYDHHIFFDQFFQSSIILMSRVV